MGLDVVSELKTRSRRIRELQSNQARLEGKREQILASLEKDFNVKTYDEGEKLHKKKVEELDSIDQKLTKNIQDMDVEMEKAKSK